MVGALLVEPQDASCVTGVIFFNNVGYLGMCGHGTIGLVATLAHLGRIQAGRIPRGNVRGHGDSRPCTTTGKCRWPMCRAGARPKGAVIEVPGIGPVAGDVAWSGNWFFLVEEHGQELSLANVEKLTDYAWRVRQAVNAQGFPEVDHIELVGPPETARGHARNFVQCPGKAYDRSPCGTGTSAKLACMAADGKLGEGAPWVQESFIGSSFTAHFRWLDRAAGRIAPVITGSAFVNAEATLLLDEKDPFCYGIRA